MVVEGALLDFLADATAFFGRLFLGLGVFFPAVPVPATFFLGDAARRAGLLFAAADFCFTILAERSLFFELDVFLAFCANFPRNL